jgi:hypothetical protein
MIKDSRGLQGIGTVNTRRDEFGTGRAHLSYAVPTTDMFLLKCL